MSFRSAVAVVEAEAAVLLEKAQLSPQRVAQAGIGLKTANTRSSCETYSFSAN